MQDALGLRKSLVWFLVCLIRRPPLSKHVLLLFGYSLIGVHCCHYDAYSNHLHYE